MSETEARSDWIAIATSEDSWVVSLKIKHTLTMVQ